MASLDGFGEALVGEVERWATGTCAYRVILSVVATNARAMAFYPRLGFIDQGPLPHASENEALDLRMEKPLAP